MALTEYERHQLQLVAEQLLRDDPRLAAKLCSGPVKPDTTRRKAAGGSALLIGSILLLAGIVAQVPPLGILGFGMACAGGYLLPLTIRGHVSRDRPKRPLPDDGGPVASA
ncbi:MAG TPA: DUF3040 domain-containing protein [Arthrobacter sp.]|jgi:hypothetical protein